MGGISTPRTGGRLGRIILAATLLSTSVAVSATVDATGDAPASPGSSSPTSSSSPPRLHRPGIFDYLTVDSNPAHHRVMVGPLLCPPGADRCEIDNGQGAAWNTGGKVTHLQWRHRPVDDPNGWVYEDMACTESPTSETETYCFTDPKTPTLERVGGLLEVACTVPGEQRLFEARFKNSAGVAAHWITRHTKAGTNHSDVTISTCEIDPPAFRDGIAHFSADQRNADQPRRPRMHHFQVGDLRCDLPREDPRCRSGHGLYNIGAPLTHLEWRYRSEGSSQWTTVEVPCEGPPGSVTDTYCFPTFFRFAEAVGGTLSVPCDVEGARMFAEVRMVNPGGASEWIRIERHGFGAGGDGSPAVSTCEFDRVVARISAVSGVDDGRALTDTPVELTARGSWATFSGEPVRYEWDLNGDGTFDRVGGHEHATVTTSWSSPRDRTVTVRVTSEGGETDTASMRVRVFAAPPPGTVGVTIDAGATEVNGYDVVVGLVWPRYATTVTLSNDPNVWGPAAQTFAVSASVPWRLDESGGPGVRSVYARFDGEITQAWRIHHADVIVAPTEADEHHSDGPEVGGGADDGDLVAAPIQVDNHHAGAAALGGDSDQGSEFNRPLSSARLVDSRDGGSTIDGRLAGLDVVEASSVVEVPVVGRGWWLVVRWR